MRKLISLISVTLLTTIAYGAEENSTAKDFKALCSLIEEARSMALPIQDEITYINTNIPKRVGTQDIIDAYRALEHVEWKKRYIVFKNAATATQEKEWTCEAMKTLYEA